ncbi:MAG: hypothetical protein NG712_04840 [Omnitrophica bacterium]|nr:hypothetical protein [Candidatus Omnitrophota bacterium]
MAKVRLAKQLLAVTENKVGMLVEVCSDISGAGVNIQAINAYSIGDKANFRLLTDNNQRANELLTAKGYQVSEQEVVLVELPNKVSVLKEAADKLKSAGINLEYIYGTTCSAGCECLLVFASDNNAKAKELLS